MVFETTMIPIVVGLLFVAIAVIERGYKQFLEAKKLDPTITFGTTYLLNLLVSTGTSAVIITVLVPNLISQTLSANTAVTIASLVLQAVLGYTITWTTLDKLNTSTDNKISTISQTSKTVEEVKPI